MKLRHASWHACGAAQPICSGQWRWGTQPLVSAEWRPPWLHSYCNVACLKMKGKATELHLSRGVVKSALLAPGGGGACLCWRHRDSTSSLLLPHADQAGLGEHALLEIQNAGSGSRAWPGNSIGGSRATRGRPEAHTGFPSYTQGAIICSSSKYS